MNKNPPQDSVPIAGRLPVSAQRRICYVCTWNHLGGTETLILRHLLWLRKNGYVGMVISPLGVMSDAYHAAASMFVELSEAQADHISMTDPELASRDDKIADAIGRDQPCHFIVFNLDGLHLAAELCSRVDGSAVSVHLVFDDIFGPERFEPLEEMNERGMVIAMNEGCLEGHREKFGYKLESSVLVPLPMVIPEAVRIPPDDTECIILTVARLVEMKGYVEGLIKDFADIARASKVPCRLLVVGDGPLRPEFERTARRTGLGHRIEFIGSVPYAELYAYYARAHVYVGMGTTLLEAAAAGVPAIIATAFTARFITPGLFGQVSGLGLGEPFSAKVQVPGREILCKLVESPEARKVAGADGRAKVVAQFDQDVVMREFLRQLDLNACKIGRFHRPKHDVPFPVARSYIKRVFGYHPWVMWFGRKISRSLNSAVSRCRMLLSNRT
jgi:glycosyltransferase involved in cell wall biosynthesis